MAVSVAVLLVIIGVGTALLVFLSQETYERLDVFTKFVFGESVDSQLSDTKFNTMRFLRSFDIFMRGLATRMMLGKLKFIRGRDTEWKQAVKEVHAYIDGHVSRVLKGGPATQEENDQHLEKRYILLDEMTKQTQDPIALRYQLLHMFIPAHNAPGIAVSNILFHLARRGDCWDKLRAEVRGVQGQPLTFELLKSMKYSRYAINESLRLHPPAGILHRICRQDTTLTYGGGPDGGAPIFVRKGSNVVMNVHAMHRDKDLWGDDANDFRPER